MCLGVVTEQAIESRAKQDGLLLSDSQLVSRVLIKKYMYAYITYVWGGERGRVAEGMATNTKDKGNYSTRVLCLELHSAVEEKACRVVELEQEQEVMEGELSAAQQAAKQAPSRTMKALVERLRNQLTMKEKQHRVSYGDHAL